jgi:hypothetical protein
MTFAQAALPYIINSSPNDVLNFGFMPRRLVTNLVIAFNPNAPKSFMPQSRCQIKNPFDKALPELSPKRPCFQ